MIESLPRHVLEELTDCHRIDRSIEALITMAIEAYDDGELSPEEIKAAWADYEWSGVGVHDL